MQKIKVMTVGDLLAGHFVADVDADYPLDTFVPDADYVAVDQDWHKVVAKQGYVDLPNLTLEMHGGETYNARWQSSAAVWVLCDEDGLPAARVDYS